jgi:DNA polymerase-3 subunit beta
MEFRIKKSEFLSGLTLAHGIADRKSTLPILANVLLRTEGDGTLLCAATDLTVAVTAELKANISAEGGLTLGARHLFDIVRSLPADEMTFKRTDNQWAEIRSGKAQYKLVGLADRDFPKLQNHREITFTKLPTEALRDMIAKTIFSVSTDETRYHLNGVLFESDGETARMVSTDGHRLSKVERKLPGAPKIEGGVIIPRKGLGEIARALDLGTTECEIGFQKTHVFLRVGTTVVSAKLVDAQFPPYQQVVPKASERKVYLDRARFIESLRRVSILASEKTSGVRLKLDVNTLEVGSDNPDLGEAREEVDVDFQGTPITISFNSRYLLEVLMQIQDTEVQLGLGGELDPCVVRPKSDSEHNSYLGVIMPMRT